MFILKRGLVAPFPLVYEAMIPKDFRPVIMPLTLVCRAEICEVVKAPTVAVVSVEKFSEVSAASWLVGVAPKNPAVPPDLPITAPSSCWSS